MNEEMNSSSRRQSLGTKKGISSWQGLMSNVHESNKHNSWYLLEVEKKTFAEIQSIVV